MTRSVGSSPIPGRWQRPHVVERPPSAQRIEEFVLTLLRSPPPPPRLQFPRNDAGRRFDLLPPPASYKET